MKLTNENSHQVFKTRRVRYARADELELYSSSTTLPEVHSSPEWSSR